MQINSINEKSPDILREIAHQWRQPLSRINSIVSVIDSILEDNGALTQELESKLLEIEEITKYMSNTINDFNRTSPAQKTLTNIHVLMQELEKIVSNDFFEHEITFISEAENTNIQSDSKKLLQVFLILLNNAKDAMLERNTYNRYIKISSMFDENHYYLRVEDNAGGIAKSTMQKIFEDDYSSKHHSEGSGYGLYMAKKIIENELDGSLRVFNYKHGACFEIVLKKNCKINTYDV